MKVGDLVRHITSKRFGMIVKFVDFTGIRENGGIHYKILWCDEEYPYWIWDNSLFMEFRKCKLVI